MNPNLLQPVGRICSAIRKYPGISVKAKHTLYDLIALEQDGLQVSAREMIALNPNNAGILKELNKEKLILCLGEGLTVDFSKLGVKQNFLLKAAKTPAKQPTLFQIRKKFRELESQTPSEFKRGATNRELLTLRSFSKKVKPTELFDTLDIYFSETVLRTRHEISVHDFCVFCLTATKTN